jgi:diguanylate cyclase (GGDEF)-like protein
MPVRTAPAPNLAGACLDLAGFSGGVAKLFEKEANGSLLHLDLDGLHQINQEHGRDVGDKAIRAATAVLKKWAQERGWLLGRIGGDEFSMFAPAVPLESAFLRADQMRQELNAAVAKQLPKGAHCTASIGVASAPRDAKTPHDLRRKADLALHTAKEQGGDTVGLTPGDEMVLKSSYYGQAQLARLKGLAERQQKKEAVLLREALDDLLRKYDRS